MGPIIETQYFPPISAMTIFMAQNARIEVHENYQKRSFRNKCYVCSPEGLLSLTVPLKKGKNNKLPITNVQIAYEEDWVTHHLRTLKNFYENAPYYEYYYPEIASILNRKYDHLWDLNFELLQWIFSKMNSPLPDTTEAYSREVEEDYRDRFGPKGELKSSCYCYYPQVYEAEMGFQCGASVLDLLMNMGSDSKAFIAPYHNLTK